MIIVEIDHADVVECEYHPQALLYDTLKEAGVPVETKAPRLRYMVMGFDVGEMRLSRGSITRELVNNENKTRYIWSEGGEDA